MRYLGAEDFLRIAAKLLGVEVDDVRSYVRLERMQHALSPPTLHIAGAGASDEAGEAARLLIEIVRCGALPEKNVHCAWICMLRFLQINDRVWRPAEDDRRRLDRFVERILSRELIGIELARWIDGHLQHDSTPTYRSHPDQNPHVHVTSALTGLPADKLAEVKDLANAVDEAVAEFSRDAGLAYEIGTFRPGWLPAANPEDPQEALNATDKRLLDTDGFVVIGVCGGSLGAGLDVAFALAALMPILYLQPADEKLSPRTKGLLRRHQVEIHRYMPGDEAEAEVRSHVRRWLSRESEAISDTRRTHTMMQLRLAPLWRVMRRSANELSQTELHRRLAAQRMSESRGRLLLSSVRQLALASAYELMALGAACGVPVTIDVPSTSAITAPLDTRPARSPAIRQVRSRSLSTQELDYLEQASKSYTGVEVARMVAAAQQTIEDEIAEMDAAGTVARRSLWDRQRWEALHQRLFA